MAYYEESELERFSEIGKYRPDLFEKFMAWYQAITMSTKKRNGAILRYTFSGGKQS
jgi:hypothetical protein